MSVYKEDDFLKEAVAHKKEFSRYLSNGENDLGRPVQFRLRSNGSFALAACEQIFFPFELYGPKALGHCF